MEDLPTIRDQISRKDLFDAFKEQLAKDFEQSNCSSQFAESLQPNYDDILNRIQQELQINERRSDFNLMQLLYRIDINEMQLKKYLGENSARIHYYVIADLIIKRTLQKVMTRKYYKGKDE